MYQLILHKNNNGGVTVCYPTPEALETYSITEIALKDTPTRAPFWIVNESEVPSDRTFRDAWELDVEALGEPTGYGMSYENWAQEYQK